MQPEEALAGAAYPLPVTSAAPPPMPAATTADPAAPFRQGKEAAKRHRDLAARLTERHRLTIPAEHSVRDIQALHLSCPGPMG